MKDKRTETPIAPLLNEFDVVRITGASISTVRRWRRNGGGPLHLKIGQLVKYRQSDLTAWIGALSDGGGK